MRPGMALGYALQQNYDTGSRNRCQRIHDKLDAIETAVESTQASTKLDKVSAITEDLCSEFLLPEFLEAAETVGVSTEKYAIKKFLPDVLNRTGTVPHPRKPGLFIPHSHDYAPKNSNPADLPYYTQTDDEKRVGIQVAAIRKAWSNGGLARLAVTEGVDALAGEGSPQHKTVRAAMRDAERRDGGFGYDDRNKALTVNTDAIDTTTEAWAIAAEERARENDDQADRNTDEPDAAPCLPDDTQENSLEADAKTEMDRIMTASLATGDGGGE